MGLLNPLKALYYALEDKYYALLDRVPVLYKIADPIDKIIPSFLLLSCFVFLCLAFFGVFMLSSIDQTYSVKVRVVELESKNPLSGAEIYYVFSGQSVVSGKKTTDSNGTILVEGLSGEYDTRFSVKKDGYSDFEKEFSVSREKSSFELGVALLKEERLPLQVELNDSETRNPIIIKSGNRAVIKFSCSNDAAIPNKYKSSSRFTILPSETETCENARISVSVENQYNESDWILLSGQSVSLYLDAKQQSKAKVIVTVKDSNTGLGVSGIIVKLVDSWQSEKESGITGSLGRWEFKPFPGTYAIHAIDNSGTYSSSESTEFIVEKDEEKNITIFVEKVPPSSQKMLKLLVRDSLTKEPLAGAKVIVSENSFLLAEKTTSSEGKIHYNASDNKIYGVMVTHPGYITNYSNAEPVMADSSSYLMINMDEIGLNADGSPINAGRIKVTVKDQKGLAQEAAIVSLYREGFSALPQKAETEYNGQAFFENLPSGKYYATATSAGKDASGRTDYKDLAAGKLLELNIVLLVGKAPIVVALEDEFGAPVKDAAITFLDSQTRELLEETISNEKGATESIEIQVSRKPTIKAEKDGFLPSIITLENLERGVKQNISLTMRRENSISSLSLIMSNCLAQKDSFKNASPQKLQSSSGRNEPKEYRLVLEAIVPKGQVHSNVVAHVRTDSDEIARATNARLYVMGYSTAYSGARSAESNPNDPFSNISEVSDSSAVAKQANIFLGTLSEGSYKFYVKIRTSNDLEDGLPLEVHYAISSGAETVSNLMKVFSINRDTLCGKGESGFSYSFLISKTGSSQKSRLEEFDGTARSPQNTIQSGAQYTVDYSILNTSSNQFEGSQAKIVEISGNAEVPAGERVLGISPTTINIPTLPKDGVASGTFSVNPNAAPNSSIKLAFKITEDKNAVFLFNVLAAKQILVEMAPQVPLNYIELPVFAKDAVTGTKLNGLVYYIINSREEEPTVAEFLSSSGTADLINGTAIVPLSGAYTPSNYLHIYVVVPEYLGTAATARFSATVASEIKELFEECITVSFESQPSDLKQKEMRYDLKETIRISTINCPTPLEVLLRSRIQGINFSPQQFSLEKTDSETVNISSTLVGGKHILGQFPIDVHARFVSGEFSKTSFDLALPEALKLIVTRKVPILTAQDCFWIQEGKFEYDVSRQTDSGAFLNNCYSGSVVSPGFPQLSSTVSGTTISSLVGQQQSDTVSFRWRPKAIARISYFGQESFSDSKAFEFPTDVIEERTINVSGIENVEKIRVSGYWKNNLYSCTSNLQYTAYLNVSPSYSTFSIKMQDNSVETVDAGFNTSNPASWPNKSCEAKCSYPLIEGWCWHYYFEKEFSSPKDIKSIKVNIYKPSYQHQVVFTLFGETSEKSRNEQQIEYAGNWSNATISAFSSVPISIGSLNFSKAQIYNAAIELHPELSAQDIIIEDINLFIETDNPIVNAWIEAQAESLSARQVVAKSFGVSGTPSNVVPFTFSNSGIMGEQYGYLTINDLIDLEAIR